jgi:uncharacterized protein YhaN
MRTGGDGYGYDEQGETHIVRRKLQEMCSSKEASNGEMVREAERTEAEGYQWESRMEEVRAQLASRNAEILTLQ